MTDQPLAYTLDDAGKITGHGRTKLYQLIAGNVLDARKAGKRTLIMGASLRAYIETLPPFQFRTPQQKAAA